jgi:hypothetical protein
MAQTGVQLEPNATEQHVLVKIRELRDAEYSLREIAAELNTQGHTNHRGSRRPMNTLWAFSRQLEAWKPAGGVAGRFGKCRFSAAGLILN